MDLTQKLEVLGKNGIAKVTMQPLSKRLHFVKLCLAKKWPELTKVAVQLMSMRTTACAAERNWSKWGLMYAKNRSCLGRERAEQMISHLMELLVLDGEEAEQLDLGV